MKDIVIIGAGGFAKEVKCLIDRINANTHQWNLLGFVDSWDKQKGDNIIDDYKVIWNINDLNNIQHEICAVVAIGNPWRVKETVECINNLNIQFVNLIHPSVEINDSIKLGKGNIISNGTIITCDVSMGDFNIFNTRCAVGHDTTIGSYNVFNPNTQISGNVTIGDGNFWGLNSSIIQGKRVGNDNKIGACSLIIRNIGNDSSYFGIPAIKQ